MMIRAVRDLGTIYAQRGPEVEGNRWRYFSKAKLKALYILLIYFARQLWKLSVQLNGFIVTLIQYYTELTINIYSAFRVLVFNYVKFTYKKFIYKMA